MKKKINFLDLGNQPLANYYLKKEQIKNKEKKYIKSGGKFIIHTPYPRVI